MNQLPDAGQRAEQESKEKYQDDVTHRQNSRNKTTQHTKKQVPKQRPTGWFPERGEGPTGGGEEETLLVMHAGKPAHQR